MKKFKILTALFVFVSFMACDQDDANVENIYDNSGQTGVGFTTPSVSVAVRPEGSSATASVQSTTTSSQDRFFDVVFNGESTGNVSDLSIGSITIPAESYNGTLTIGLVDTNLVEGVAYSAILDLDLPAGVAIVGSGSLTINYNKYLICNDFTLTMNEDGWTSERSWNIVDAAGVVVASQVYNTNFPGGSGLITENIYLEDGCYTFTIEDSYGDGQFDGVTTGNYSLDCSIINVANGEGNWGSSESTDFCVNP
jgi:hypothetical protein